MMRPARRAAGIALDGAAWRPGHLEFLLRGVVRRDRPVASDEEHLRAAAAWLARAQDAMTDGGVGGRYRLDGSGWTSSYPETTGYIVPTFLRLAAALGDDSFRSRAQRCVEFLRPLQLPGGAFPGGEVHENTSEPSVFNTAQILHGLVSWHRETGDTATEESCRRAADWLVDVQGGDGGWHDHVYWDLSCAYHAHASCWLAECGDHLGEERYLEAARRHLEWVLRFRDPETGFIDRMGFSAEDHEERRAFTHTIAYTVWGVLMTAELLGHTEGIAAATQAAAGLARRIELSRGLPGILDHRWRRQADFKCLTGSVQMSLVWLRLYRRDGDARWLNAALRGIDDVKGAQALESRDPGIRGGVAGSFPAWGSYLKLALPNWAAKYAVDALLEKQAVLAALSERPRARVSLRSDLAHELPPPPERAEKSGLRVVLYSRPATPKLAQMLEAFGKWGFQPDCVVLEHVPDPPARERLRRRIRDDGFAPLVDRVLGRFRGGGGGEEKGAADAPSFPDAATYCAERGIPVLDVGRLSEPAAVARVAEREPDLAIHAGAGILRAPLLALPRLGTLNAHMGILPYYRGVNVTEWARFNGDAVGCTVHLIAPGIDTGEILCVREIDADSPRSIPELRAAVDRAQLGLLSDVLRFAVASGELPPRSPQSADEGVQFFRMHPDLQGELSRELSGADR